MSARYLNSELIDADAWSLSGSDDIAGEELDSSSVSEADSDQDAALSASLGPHGRGQR